MKDLKLDNSNDIEISNFDVRLTTDTEILPQWIKQNLHTFVGEYFYDNTLGIPYFQQILGQQNSLDTIRAIYINAITSLKEVKELVEFNMSEDTQARLLSINFKIIDFKENYYTIDM